MSKDLDLLAKKASEISILHSELEAKLREAALNFHDATHQNEHALLLFTIFILSCIVGYYVVWRVTPALHTPLMAVTNAISGIIIIGGMMAAGLEGLSGGTLLGLIAIFLASVNIFGGFIVTSRMLMMFKKKNN